MYLYIAVGADAATAAAETKIQSITLFALLCCVVCTTILHLRVFEIDIHRVRILISYFTLYMCLMWHSHNLCSIVKIESMLISFGL